MAKVPAGMSNSFTDVGKVLLGFGERIPGWMKYLFGVSAAAPIIGYALDPNKGKSKPIRQPARQRVNEPLVDPRLVNPVRGISNWVGSSGLMGSSSNPYFESIKSSSSLAQLGEIGLVSKLSLQRDLGIPVKLADLNELGIMLRHAKEHSRKDEKGSLLQGLDSEPKDELDLEEQEESAQPEGPQGPSYSTLGGGLGRGPG